jgi:predicted nucleic acid-binding protein
VDAVSFVAMREKGLAEAFAYDPHFAQEGFSLAG